LFAKFLIAAFPSVAVDRVLGLIPTIHYISDFILEGTLGDAAQAVSPAEISLRMKAKKQYRFCDCHNLPGKVP